MNPRHARRNGFLRTELPSDHLVTRLFDEHSRLLASIERLEGLTASQYNDPADPGDRMVLEEIRDLAARLVHPTSHEEREERVLIPALELYACAAVMREEHERLRALTRGLFERTSGLLAGACECWIDVRTVARELIATLRAHIEREERELYPAALELESVEKLQEEWRQAGEDCVLS